MREENRNLVILFLVALLGFSVRMAHTAKSPYLVNGIDGPYYVSQIDHLVDTGKMLHKDSPLTFYYLILWRYLVGDTIRALKVGMSIATGLFCVPAFCLMRRITGNQTAALCSAFVSVFNPYLFTMTYNLYKNEVGLLLMLVFFAFLFRFISIDGIRKQWRLLTLLVLVFLAIWTTHIMATGMTVLFILSYLAVALLRDRQMARRALRLLAVAAAIGGCALVVLSLLFPASFYKVYKLQFLSNLLRDESEVPRFMPDREQPAYPMIRFVLTNLGPVKWFGFPALVAVVALLWAAWNGKNVPGELFILSTYLSWLGFVQPTISHELVWRFALASFVPLCLAIGYGLATIRRKLPCLISLFVLVLVLAISFVEAFAAARQARTTISEPEYLELVRMRSFIPENCAIVGNVGQAYWYEAVLHRKIVRSVYVDEEDYSQGELLLIVSKRRAPIGDSPLPPGIQPGPQPVQPPLPDRLKARARLIFDGRYFSAYLLPPSPQAIR